MQNDKPSRGDEQLIRAVRAQLQLEHAADMMQMRQRVDDLENALRALRGQFDTLRMELMEGK
jgi:hypothetical protein